MTMHRRSLFAATALGAIAAPGLALGAAATEQAPGFYRFKVGQRTVTVVHDGFAHVPDILHGFVRNAPAEAVEASLRESFMLPPGLDIVFTITFVETTAGLVVFDTGTGNQLGSPHAGTIAANMRAAGIDPAAVTRVVISHFHGDHITGLTTPEDAPIFPNAALWVPDPEYAYWMDDGVMSRAPAGMQGAFRNVRRRLAPYAARMERYAAGAEVAPGLRAVATHGHTPGHMSFTLADGNDSLMILSDVTNHSELNLKNPGWHLVFDMDPVLAEATRRRVFDQVATDRLRCIGYHFPFPANGHVVKTAGGYRFIPAIWTAAI